MDEALPHNLETERGLLGSIFLSNDVYFDVMETVTKADFFEPANGEIFNLMADQIGAGRSVTPLTLLADVSQDRDIGGIHASEYLRRLQEQGAPLRLAVDLARTIADLALTRRMIVVANELIHEARNKPVSILATALREKYDVAFGALFSTGRDLGIRHIADEGDNVISGLEEALRERAPMLACRWGSRPRGPDGQASAGKALRHRGRTRSRANLRFSNRSSSTRHRSSMRPASRPAMP